MQDTATIFKVLIICTGNICRSPMAEVMIRSLLTNKQREVIKLSSAGTNSPGGISAEPYAIQAMKDFGVDITGHRSRSLKREMVLESNLILVMEHIHAQLIKKMAPHYKDKVRLLKEFGPNKAPEDVFDPYGGSLADYQECATTIKECLQGVMSFIEKSFF